MEPPSKSKKEQFEKLNPKILKSAQLKGQNIPFKSQNGLNFVPPIRKSKRARQLWVAFSWLCSWYIPSFLLNLFGIKGGSQQMAWREKYALCSIITFVSIFFVLWVEVVPSLLCDTYSNIYDTTKIEANPNFIAIRGKIYDMNKAAPLGTSPIEIRAKEIAAVLGPYGGRDATSLFPSIPYLGRAVNSTAYPNSKINACVQNTTTADQFVSEYFGTLSNPQLDNSGNLFNCREPRFLSPNKVSPLFANDSMNCFNLALYGPALNLLYVGQLALTAEEVYPKTPTNLKRFVMSDRVMDITDFFDISTVQIGQYSSNITTVRNDTLLFPFQTTELIVTSVKTNNTLFVDDTTAQCMSLLFDVGKANLGIPISCQIIYPILIACGVALYIVVFLKFLLSLQFGLKPHPAYQKEYAILFVPCYTEDRESLQKTIDSLADLAYDDQRKLLFVVCDGVLTGAGNSKPTSTFVLDILGYNSFEPEPHKYEALGHGERRQNRAKVYCGYYYYDNHVVPYIIVVKIGNLLEAERPGNRGKRDSQLILMNFLKKINSPNAELLPLEYELFYNINNLLEVNPSVYNYVLMVDADTEADPLSMNYMIANMVVDTDVIAVCGETRVSNKYDSFTTMIQVYEYFMSHHLGKAFESVFGNVTCLPGCFSLYRVKSATGELFLCNEDLIKEYSVNTVETLHMKNLLHLGEDRYLTTLMLKYFTENKLSFISDAVCYTVIPDKFSVLLSQRRRWINSTMHNLWELVQVKGLCGFACCLFSMRYVVALDMIGTACMPVSLLYFYYTIVKACIYGFTPFSFVIISFFSLYVMHIAIFFVKNRLENFFWLFIYLIFSLPVFSIILPIYAFWHFDDFSWGKTRKIQEANQKLVDEDLMMASIEKHDLADWMAQDERFAKEKPQLAINAKIIPLNHKGFRWSAYGKVSSPTSPFFLNQAEKDLHQHGKPKVSSPIKEEPELRK